MWMFILGMFTVKRLWRNVVYLIEHKHLQRVKGFTIWWKLMKVGELASRNRGQADIVVIPLHCLIRVTLHQLESWGKKQHTVRNKGFSRHYSLSKSQETQIMACSHFLLSHWDSSSLSHKLHTHSLSLLFICQGYCVIFNPLANAGIYVSVATCIIQTFLNLKRVSYLYLYQHCGIFKHSWCSLFSENRMGVSIITSMNINNKWYTLLYTTCGIPQ